VRVRTTGGATVLTGMPGVASVNDYGRTQDVRLTVDAQGFLTGLADRTAIDYFEIVRPSLHDIFVRIATPGGDHAAVE
jgi:ABC-2 type transport system ATP-binding protein